MRAHSERNVLKVLEGDCETAVGAFSKIEGSKITLEAELFSLDGLDRFYEGDKKGGILSIIGWGIVFTSFLYLKCSGVEYVDGVKDYSNYSPNPLIVLPLIAGLYGIYLILRKGFRLAKQFENAED